MKTKPKMTAFFKQELIAGIKEFLVMQCMIGDYVVCFSDEDRYYGYIHDPKGPRWVHVFIQNPHAHRQFEYNVALVDDSSPIYINILDKDVELEKAALFEERQKLVNVIANKPVMWVDEAHRTGARLTQVPESIRDQVAEEIAVVIKEATVRIRRERYFSDLMYKEPADDED